LQAFQELDHIARKWEAEFRRNKQVYGAKMRCGKGCNDCCHHLFVITELEGARISHAVKALPDAVRVDLQQNAREYLEKRQQLLATRTVEDAWGSLPPSGLRLSCPALGKQGECRIYPARPLICHKYGMPLFNPAKPDRIFACELNFQPGEELDVEDLVQIQTVLHDEWKQVQGRYNSTGGRRDPQPITVARALLEDFESFLPPPDTPLPKKD
jgi:Fe-S-cluster containining protein